MKLIYLPPSPPYLERGVVTLSQSFLLVYSKSSSLYSPPTPARLDWFVSPVLNNNSSRVGRSSWFSLRLWSKSPVLQSPLEGSKLVSDRSFQSNEKPYLRRLLRCLWDLVLVHGKDWSILWAANGSYRWTRWDYRPIVSHSIHRLVQELWKVSPLHRRWELQRSMLLTPLASFREAGLSWLVVDRIERNPSWPKPLFDLKCKDCQGEINRRTILLRSEIVVRNE